MAENPAIVLQPPTHSIFNDGDYTGANGVSGGRTPPGSVRGFNPSRINFWQITPITPAIGERHPATPVLRKRIVYINGIGTPRAAHAYTLKLITVITGAVVIGIYNQSGDGVRANILNDLVQCLGDKTGIGNNPATNTLGQAVFDSCVGGTSLNVVAHSQGAIIASRGVRQGIGKMLDHYGRNDKEVRPFIEQIERERGFFSNVGRAILGLNNIERLQLQMLLQEKILPIVEQRLSAYVSVQTFGGAGRFFPNGPRYRHVFNSWDPVPNLFGQGDIFTGPGRGARVEQIDRNAGLPIRDFDDHSMDNVYLQASEYFVDRSGRRVDNNYIPIDMNMVRS
ncbi:MAG: hypothetical protein M3T96_06890 [Acidobacteriota bacterium]|nr:hypothetical protein [Acidobacteriota bacterium]